MWMIRRIGVASLAVSLLPFVAMIAAMAIAAAFDCVIGDNGVPPCFVLGTDISFLIRTLLTSGVAGLLLVPPGLAITALWVVIELIHALHARWHGP